MSIIYILIPLAAILTAVGIYLFFWAVKTDQFQDLEKEGMSILFEENKDKDDPNKLDKEQPPSEESVKRNDD